MKANFEMTREDFLQFNLYHHAHSPALRKQRAFVVGTCVVCALLIAAVIQLPADPEGNLSALWMIVLFFLLFAAMIPMTWKRGLSKTVDRMLTEGKNHAMLGKKEILITPVEISAAGELKSMIVRWKAVERIEQESDILYVYISSVE